MFSLPFEVFLAAISVLEARIHPTFLLLLVEDFLGFFESVLDTVSEVTVLFKS